MFNKYPRYNDLPKKAFIVFEGRAYIWLLDNEEYKYKAKYKSIKYKKSY